MWCVSESLGELEYDVDWGSTSGWIDFEFARIILTRTILSDNVRDSFSVFNVQNMNESMLPIDDPGNRRLPPLLRRAWYSLNQAFRRRIAHLDITPNQFTILRWLLEGDPEA